MAGQDALEGWTVLESCTPGSWSHLFRSLLGGFLCRQMGAWGSVRGEPFSSAGRNWEGASELCPEAGKWKIPCAVILSRPFLLLIPNPCLTELSVCFLLRVGSYTCSLRRKGPKRLRKVTFSCLKLPSFGSLDHRCV